jgi:hypothetical protein
MSAFGMMIKEADYSALKNFDYKKLPETIKLRFAEFVAKFKTVEVAKSAVVRPAKLKITDSPKIQEVQRSLPVEPVMETESELEDEIVDEVEEVEELEHSEEIEAEAEEYIDSVDSDEEEEESDEEMEEVDSPFQMKKKDVSIFLRICFME